MNSLEKFMETQNHLAERYKQMMPSPVVIAELEKSAEALKNFSSTYAPIIKMINSVRVDLPPSILNQIKLITDLTTKIEFSYPSDILRAQVYFSRLNFKDIPTYQIPGISRLISSSVISTSKNLFASLEQSVPIIASANIVHLPDNLFLPCVSGVMHGKVLQALKIVELSQDSYDDAIFEDVDVEEDAEQLIKKVNPSWLCMLQGAESSIRSRNPDKVRHTITSLRELMTQILHTFAPDNEVKEKIHSASAFHNGMLTRKARIQYILRRQGRPEVLDDIINKDVDAIIALFDLYQYGTHTVVTELTDKDLVLILKRTKLIVEQLIYE